MLYALCFRSVVLKPVLGTPNHSIFCMSPSFNTPDSTHQLISRIGKTWTGCVIWETHTKYVVAGGPQDRFENHCFRSPIKASAKCIIDICSKKKKLIKINKVTKILVCILVNICCQNKHTRIQGPKQTYNKCQINLKMILGSIIN